MTFVKHREWLRPIALACVIALVPGDIPLRAQQEAGTQPAAPKPKTPDELDSLVAPLALYPDPLLAQVLAASTYPLEIVQCARWLKENSKLTGENLTKAAAKQPWDPSVSALVAFPDALKLLDANIQWAQDLGNAFLDNQSGVMDAIQRMRKKAKDAGKLETSKEQKVEVQTVESKQVIVIQPADPQVIYVPTYNPVVVYGPPVYAYPPVVYPSTGAIVATAAISFGVGVAMGAMWGGCCGGGYGWNTGWGGNNNITINNNFNNRYNNVQGGNRNNINTGNINTGNRNNVGSGNSSWQHNPQHRQSVPYTNKDTANRVGASDRSSSARNDRSNAGASTNDRGGNRDAGATNRGGQSQARSGGSQDRVGSRDVGGSKGSNSALGGGGSRAQTQAQSDRGFSSSRQSSGGGGAARSSGGGGARSSGASRSGGGGRRR